MNVSQILEAIPQGGWYVTGDGRIRKPGSTWLGVDIPVDVCPICSIYRERTGDTTEYVAYWSPKVLKALGHTEEDGPVMEIASAADNPRHPLRASLMAACGL